MKLKEILDIEACKRTVAECAPHSVAILCPHYSINISAKYGDNAEQLGWDLDEFGKELGQYLYVTDYDDLVCDPYGIDNDANEIVVRNNESGELKSFDDLDEFIDYAVKVFAENEVDDVAKLETYESAVIYLSEYCSNLTIVKNTING